MDSPTLLEADVLLHARDEFRRRKDLQTKHGLTSASTPAQFARAEARYCRAALKNAQDAKDWPASQPRRAE